MESDDLFDEPEPRRRAANKTTGRAPLAIMLTCWPGEFCLQHNEPGPSGVIGGLQRMENWALEATDQKTLSCLFDPVHFMRLVIYFKSYGSGGPNGRLRATFGPALARLGIVLSPGWGEQTKG